MTIDEARTKWCCNDNTESNAQRCEAERCMAWRWFERIDSGSGYCGLAGKEGAK